jgi:hypothetical protein
MGGIFYILLLIGILINKAFKKILTLINRTPPKDIFIKLKRHYPTFAFVVCILLLVFMNLTGFRFVLFSGVGNTTIPTTHLWITGTFAVSSFGLVLLLFYRKASQRGS